jgi:hypothetical protein
MKYKDSVKTHNEIRQEIVTCESVQWKSFGRYFNSCSGGIHKIAHKEYIL